MKTTDEYLDEIDDLLTEYVYARDTFTSSHTISPKTYANQREEMYNRKRDLFNMIKEYKNAAL